jgi:hypothetical protein
MILPLTAAGLGLGATSGALFGAATGEDGPGIARDAAVGGGIGALAGAGIAALRRPTSVPKARPASPVPEVPQDVVPDVTAGSPAIPVAPPKNKYKPDHLRDLPGIQQLDDFHGSILDNNFELDHLHDALSSALLDVGTNVPPERSVTDQAHTMTWAVKSMRAHAERAKARNEVPTLDHDDINGIKDSFVVSLQDQLQKDPVANTPEALQRLEEFKRAEHIVGGKADGIPDSSFDAKDLAMGTAHEMEHTNDMSVAKEIAKDHLKEDPKYYQKLKAIEAKHKTAALAW